MTESGFQSVVDVFKETVRRFSEKEAISDQYGALTYGELDAASDNIAYRLNKISNASNSIAAVYVPRVKEVAVAAIAAWKAGFAYVPLDSSIPIERARYILSETSARVLLTTRKLWQNRPLPVDETQVLFLDEQPHVKNQLFVYHGTQAPNDIALLLYTSGTTGKPKGVIRSHRSLMGMIHNPGLDTHELSPSTRYAVIANFGFVVSVLFLFAPLLFGASTHIIPPDARNDVRSIYDYFRNHRITDAYLSSSVGVMMLEKYDLGGITLWLAGEKVRCFTAAAPYSAWNMYGATEGLIVAAGRIVNSNIPIPIGKPCPGVTAFLADEDLHPVAAGEIGELIYHAPLMAEGYYHLPEETAKKWVTINGLRYFRTGDRMKIDADGQLLFIGRNDSVVKLRGNRVDLCEVEQQVLAYTQKYFPKEEKLRVTLCKVQQIGGKDELCCYYELDSEIDGSLLNTRLAEVLPSYMLPSFYIRMDQLPRNPNGKLDRKNLPLPAIDEFDVPLDSLEIIRISAEVYDAFGIDISFQILFEAGTRFNVFDLIIDAVDARQKGITSSSDDESDIYVYSSHPAHQPLVFIHSANTGSEAYSTLSKRIAKDYTFSVIEQYDLRHPGTAHTTIESVAKTYIKILKKHQPQGPYYLGGWCYGDVVAYEMAQQLIHAGETVDRLVLIDSYLAEDPALKASLRCTSGANARTYLSTAPVFEKVRNMGLLEALIESYTRKLSALLSYEPSAYHGKVLYVKAGRKPEHLSSDQNALYDMIVDSVAGGFEKVIAPNNMRIITVPSDHDSLMRPKSLDIIVPALHDFLR